MLFCRGRQRDALRSTAASASDVHRTDVALVATFPMPGERHHGGSSGVDHSLRAIDFTPTSKSFPSSSREPAVPGPQLYEGLYVQRRPLEDLTNMPKALRCASSGRRLPLALAAGHHADSTDGATTKWLWRTADGAQVETVLMAATRPRTVCVSSQAGCAMGCTFCATGQAGFERHLDAGEIVEQVMRAPARATSSASRNVVFMGMGEPLANVDDVLRALERLHDDLGLSARHLTVSTVGVVPGMRRLAEHPLPVTLAVSLHAPDDELRETLVPLNRRYPIARR